MNSTENYSGDDWSDESGSEESIEAICYQFSSAGKRCYEDQEDYPVKRYIYEEPDLDKPSTSGIASTSYNVEPSTQKKILHGLTDQDYIWSDQTSDEESNDIRCLSANNSCYEEDGDCSNITQKLEELELIKPNTDETPSTSYNVESSVPRRTLYEVTDQEAGNEESNDVAVCCQPLSTEKRPFEEDEYYPVKRQKNKDWELIQPSTSGITSNSYNVVSSAPKKTLHGLTYQLRLLMLFVQRVPDGQEFFLATEMHEAGLFDDIVLKYLQDGIWRFRFLQAKHKNDDTYKIKKIDLFNKKSKSKKKSESSKNVGETKPYLLKKYFESYCVIKENTFFNDANLEEFLICTNVGFDDEAITYFKRTKEIDNDPILGNRVDFERINPVKFKLRKDKFRELKEDFEVNSQNEIFFSNFVKVFRFLTNYEDNELNVNVQNCLKQYYKIENVDLANAYLQSRVLKWFESYADNKSRYWHIKDKEEFLKTLNNNIESLLVAGYSTFYTEELKSYGVQFQNTLPLHEFFDHKKCKIMFIITETPKLSIIKLSQLFHELELKQDEVIITNGGQLNYNKKIFATFFADPSYKWLVIEYHHNEIKLSRKMLNKISEMYSGKTVVIIGRENHVLSFNKCLGLITSCFYDENNLFKDLTIASQKKILNNQVIFQGEKINLNKLININSARNIIDKVILEELQTETAKIGNNDASISDSLVEECYIQRKLIRRKLRSDTLQNMEFLKSCLFIISGVDKNQLKDLNINSEWIFVWENGRFFENGIIICKEIESEDIFKELCNNNTKNVCWLEYIRGKFLIMNIKNETDILQNQIICLKEDELDKEQILKKKIIIIADGPGCGKSVFMTRVARHLKHKMSNILVLRINLSSYAYKQEGQKQIVKCLEDIEFKDNETNKAIEFIADLLFPQEHKKENKQFVKELFTQSLYCLNDNMKFPKVILLFDGFDEISPTFKEKTITLLQALRNSNVKQMWIATRNHEELSLEVALHSSSFFLKPLDFTEKVDFLQKFWKYNLVNFDNIKPKPDSKNALTYLAEITDNICNWDHIFISNSFLDLREHWPHTHNYPKLQLLLSTVDFSFIAEHLINYFKYRNVDKISEFTGNPLLLKMIAEIIVFKKFSSLDKLDIFSLYEGFVEYKWAVFRDDKNAAGNSVAGRDSFKTYLEYLTTYHQEVAFKSLFRPYDNKQVRKESDKIELSRAGLLVIHNDRLEFLHRSFAEYFVSHYFAKYFKRKEIQKIIFSEALVKENYSLIRKFLNSNTKFLDKLSSKTPQIIENIRVNGSEAKILYQMLKEYQYNLFIKVLENLPLDFVKNAILFDENNNRETVLHEICGHIDDEQILENLFKALKDNVSLETFNELFFKKDKGRRIAAHCINFNGKKSIVKKKMEFFKCNCDSKFFIDLLLQINGRKETILHIACSNGLDITYLLEVTNETRRSIGYLLLKSDSSGRTALFNTIEVSNSPYLLTTLLNLIKAVCNVKDIKYLYAKESYSRNLLHAACSQSNEDILIIFLNAIKNEYGMFQKFLTKTDIDGLSALHHTVLNLSNFDRLKRLLDFVNSNCSIKTLHTLLCQKTRYGTTILHMAVENLKNIYDHTSLTPLLSYLFNLVKDDKEIFYKLLLTTDGKGQTVLHYTFSQRKCPLLGSELLDFVEKNCNANILDELLLKLGDNENNMLH